MDRVAVFVDAGYLFAQGSVLLAGKKLPRGDVSLAHDEAIKAFGEFATKISGVPCSGSIGTTGHQPARPRNILH